MGPLIATIERACCPSAGRVPWSLPGDPINLLAKYNQSATSTRAGPRTPITAFEQDVYRPRTAAGDVYLKLMVIDDVLIVSCQASLVDPGVIARVRKKLALDQRQAAAIFGGGANAFSRYENGKTKPPSRW